MRNTALHNQKYITALSPHNTGTRAGQGTENFPTDNILKQATNRNHMHIARIIKLEAGFLWAFAVIIALKDKDNG